MGAEALKIVGGILAAGAFVLMIAIIWFKWRDGRRIL